MHIAYLEAQSCAYILIHINVISLKVILIMIYIIY